MSGECMRLREMVQATSESTDTRNAASFSHLQAQQEAFQSEIAEKMNALHALVLTPQGTHDGMTPEFQRDLTTVLANWEGQRAQTLQQTLNNFCAEMETWCQAYVANAQQGLKNALVQEFQQHVQNTIGATV